jgi:hypothetical protein
MCRFPMLAAADSCSPVQIEAPTHVSFSKNFLGPRTDSSVGWDREGHRSFREKTPGIWRKGTQEHIMHDFISPSMFSAMGTSARDMLGWRPFVLNFSCRMGLHVEYNSEEDEVAMNIDVLRVPSHISRILRHSAAPPFQAYHVKNRRCLTLSTREA